MDRLPDKGTVFNPNGCDFSSERRSSKLLAIVTMSLKHFSIYHNPHCSKSRAALAWLQAHGIEPQVIDYLQAPLSVQTIEELLTKLGLGVHEILRDNEEEFAALQLADPQKTEADLIAAIVAHPILLQRPIVVAGNRAVIARPTEKIAELLEV